MSSETDFNELGKEYRSHKKKIIITTPPYNVISSKSKLENLYIEIKREIVRVLKLDTSDHNKRLLNLFDAIDNWLLNASLLKQKIYQFYDLNKYLRNNPHTSKLEKINTIFTGETLIGNVTLHFIEDIELGGFLEDYIIKSSTILDKFSVFISDVDSRFSVHRNMYFSTLIEKINTNLGESINVEFKRILDECNSTLSGTILNDNSVTPTKKSLRNEYVHNKTTFDMKNHPILAYNWKRENKHLFLDYYINELPVVSIVENLNKVIPYLFLNFIKIYIEDNYTDTTISSINLSDCSINFVNNFVKHDEYEYGEEYDKQEFTIIENHLDGFILSTKMLNKNIFNKQI